MLDELLSPFEAGINEQLRYIEFQIKNLELEKEALLRTLDRAKKANITQKTRKNGIIKVGIESRVIDALNRSLNKIATRDFLYRDILGLEPNLIKVTFGTHLDRMKKKGIIKSAGYGRWQLVEEKSN